MFLYISEDGVCNFALNLFFPSKICGNNVISFNAVLVYIYHCNGRQYT